MQRRWSFVGINFDHMHMGDLLRQVHEHPQAEIAGICDEEPARMQQAIKDFGLAGGQVFTDYRACLEQLAPDVAILCPSTAQHADWVERVAPYNTHVLVEKPFAASLSEADRMIAAMQASDKTLVINWPLAWYPPHNTAKRLIDAGTIGDVLEVHYYDGNRGPTFHRDDKIEINAAEALQRKLDSWWYRPEKGGGSLLDYLGYGVTLGTWFQNGRAPLELTSMLYQPPGLAVDEHSMTIARYAHGLSKFETRWGTFSDPWLHQPQPKCGFVIVGSAGTISSYDYESTVRVQTADDPAGKVVPVDRLEPPFQNPIQYLLHCLDTGTQISGPLSPRISRIGQQMVDTAILSAREQRSVPLLS